MDVVEAVKHRRSIRAFKQESVNKDIVEKILEISTYSPSATNSQPWEFTVIAGEVLDKIRQAHIEMLKSDVASCLDFHFDTYPKDSIYQKRQVDLGMQIFSLMGIQRGDKKKRAWWREKGFRYFDAPVAIIVSMDKLISGQVTPWIDIGCITQTLCLVAESFGLGTCIAYQGAGYPDILRKYAGIPESKVIIVSIALGVPDWDSQANKLERTRESVDKITRWCGFDG